MIVWLIRLGLLLEIAFGLSALVGWMIDTPALATLGKRWIPMAPSTALFFILFGLLALLRSMRQLSERAQRIVVLSALLSSALVLVLQVSAAFGIHWNAERLGLPIAGTLEGAPLGFMSPLTGGCFILAGLSLLLVPNYSTPGRRFRLRLTLAITSAGVLVLTSTTLLIGYAMAVPVFYGSPVIPPALTTTLAFLALGMSLVGLGLTRTQSAAPPAPSSSQGLRLVLLFGCLAVGVIASGYFYQQAQQAQHRLSVEHQLAVIADLKTSELDQWRRERLADASLFYGNAAFSMAVSRALVSPDGMSSSLADWLESALTAGLYDAVFFIDALGQQRVSIPDGSAPSQSQMTRIAFEVLQTGQVTMTDFHQVEPESSPVICVFVPVYESIQERRALGVVALQTDPSSYLYDIIAQWPTPSSSARTDLVKRDGEDVLFLNPAGADKRDALTERRPLADMSLPAVRAALGEEGIVEGIGLNGNRVVAALRQVPDSPWALLVSLDLADVYAPLQAQGVAVTVVVATMLVLAAIGIALLWRNQRLRAFRDHYEASARLRESETKYRELLDTMMEGYQIVDSSYRYLYVNEAAAVHGRHAREELLGHTMMEVYPGIEQTSLFRALRTCMTERIPDVLENRFEYPDGSHSWFSLTLQPVAQGVSILSIDISDRERARSALERRELMYRSLVSNIPGMTYRAKPDWTVEVLSKSKLVCGYAEEEFHSGDVQWLNLVLAEDRASVMSEAERLQHGPSSSAHEYRIMAKDSTIRWVRDHKTSFFAEGGVFAGVDGVVFDITDEKRAELSIIASEAKYRLLYETSGVAIVIAAPPTWHFESGNPSAISIFGAVDEEDLISHTPWNYSPPTQPDGRPSPDKAREMIELAIQNGSHSFEWMHRRLTGEEFPAQVLLTRFELEGRTLIQGRIRDVSSERRLEEQLRQAQKLEAIGLLAGGVAHDFNNILTGIRGYVGFALDGSAPEEQVQADLEETLVLVDRAADLTRQLLAFGRKQTLDMQPIGLNGLVGEHVKMLERLLGEDIEIQFVPGRNLNAVNADSSQITQLLMNLAVNARDAMPDGGRLTIETNNIMLSEEYASISEGVRSGPHVVIAVSDTGVGMDAATRARIFEPFFTTKEQGKGTGLGLATVYGIIKQHEGSITVYSEPGLGTTFRIYLPKTAGNEAELADTRQAVSGGREALLVVEDEAAVREITRRWLEGRGYQVFSAADASEAQGLAEGAQAIDLLLTDVVLPGPSGRELYETLVRARPKLKVLYMSGYTDGTIAHHGVLNRGVPFIQKPFDETALAARVRAVLDSEGGEEEHARDDAG